VTKGAFRLTTDIFRKYQTRRAINIRAGTVTAGVRGTDLWGKSDSEKDLICLLEGRIVVSHPEGEATELSEPLQYYAADKGKAPGPVASIDQQQLAAWAAQTELQDGVGTAKRGGRWAVTLTTAESQAVALDVYDRAVASGVTPKIRPVKAEDESYRYELSVRQIASEAQARQVAERLARELDLPAPRVTRR
jgi:hypothetical protein